MFTLKLTLLVLAAGATAVAIRWAYQEIQWVNTLERIIRDDTPWPTITQEER